jgi:hypothetical protein
MARPDNADRPTLDDVYARKCIRALLVSLLVLGVCWWAFIWCVDNDFLALERWARAIGEEGFAGIVPWVIGVLLVFPMAVGFAAVLHCRSNWTRTRWWGSGAAVAAGLLAGSTLLRTWRGALVLVDPAGSQRSLLPPGMLRNCTAALVLLSSFFFAGGYWKADRLWRRQRDNQCLACGYDLRGSPGGRCPECGSCRPLTETDRGPGRE